MSCVISDLRICEEIDVIWCNLPKMAFIRIFFFSNVYSPGEGRKLKDCVSRMGEAAPLFAFVALLGRLRSWNHHLLNPFGSHPNIPELMLKIHEISASCLRQCCGPFCAFFQCGRGQRGWNSAFTSCRLDPLRGTPKPQGWPSKV